jgi:hypothetical protein
LKPHVDELVCLYDPEDFYAVGQFYDDFSQVTDDEVIDLLRRAASSSFTQEVVSSEDPNEHQHQMVQLAGDLWRLCTSSATAA